MSKKTPRPTATREALSKRGRAVLRALKRLYPDARISLDFRNPFELYVATVLSAQCTDVRVNLVTPALLRRFPNPKKMAAGPRDEIEELIRSTGFFRNKAKSLQEAAKRILDAYGGQIPDSMEELLTLPGIGRKTANVILGNGFGIAAGVTVDTHVRRLSQRLELTAHQDPVKIELDLMEVIPRKEWTLFSHLFIHHGRALCKARKPQCADCPLTPHCPSAREALSTQPRKSASRAPMKKKTRKKKTG